MHDEPIGYQYNLAFHERAISKVKFVYDYVFVSSLDNYISVWDLSGKLLGIYKSHQGAVCAIDIQKDKLISGSADFRCILWDVTTAKPISEHKTNSTVRDNRFLTNNSYIFLNDDAYKQNYSINLADTRTNKFVELITPDKATQLLTKQSCSDTLIFSDTFGSLHKFDLRIKKIIETKKAHTDKITELKQSICGEYFISSSFDYKINIVDWDSFKIIKTLISNDSVNSASIFSRHDKLLCGGGIAARNVTNTKSSRQTFEVAVFDVATEKLLGSYAPHFGTIHSLDVHYSDEYFVSGGEDGIVCLINFCENFRNAGFTDLIDLYKKECLK